MYSRKLNITQTNLIMDGNLVITEMSVPNNRVRIDYIQFGLGLEYDNEWILNASNKTTAFVYGFL